jgi:hypothetical protein
LGEDERRDKTVQRVMKNDTSSPMVRLVESIPLSFLKTERHLYSFVQSLQRTSACSRTSSVALACLSGG